MTDNEDKAVTDAPTLSESQWRVWALTSAILTFVGVGAAFIAIFGDGFDGEADLKLAQALSPFGVAAFALVTFLTACWRGSINTRQADIAEREGRAKLLQEGAKLLAERDKDAHISAGIASLEILISGPDRRLALQAMNLIADFVQRELSDNPGGRFSEEAFGALAVGAKLGIVAQRTVRFACDDERVQWPPIEGIKAVTFTNGTIEGFLGQYDFKDQPNFSYYGTRFNFYNGLKIDGRFSNCTFSYCEISMWRQRGGLSTATFEDCDFSSATILLSQGTALESLKERKNYFQSRLPPSIKVGAEFIEDPSEFLVVKRPKPA